jgi:hypothetical protein
MQKTRFELAVITAALALTHSAYAQSALPKAQLAKPPEPTSDPQSVTEVKAGSPWAASDEVERAPLGGAVLRLRLVLPGDYGTWAYAPGKLGLTSAAVAGGEIALSSRWSLQLEGADDPFTRQFSGMIAGLRFHLLPLESKLQLSMAGGYTEDLGGGQGLWSQLNASDEVGPWRFTGALRASHVWGQATQASLSANAGAALDLTSARVELESAFERQGVARAALLPSVVVPAEGDRIMLRAGPVLPLSGSKLLPGRVSVFGNF